MIPLAAAAGAIIALALAALRLFAGPTLYDRTLAANAILAKAVLVCAAAAVLAQRADYVDAAFVLLLSGLVVNVAILKFFRLGTFQAPLALRREQE